MADTKQNKALQQEINALKEQEISLTEELVSLRNTLASISEKDAKNLEKIKSLREKILELENKSEKVANQIVDIQGNIFSTQDQILQSREDERNVVDDLVSSDKVREILSKKQLKTYEQIDDVYDRTTGLSEQLLKNENLSLDSISRIKSIQESSTLEQAAFNGLLVNDVSNRDQILKIMKSSADVSSLSLDLEEKISSAQESASNGKLEMINLTREQNALDEINNILQNESHSLSEGVVEVLKQKAELLKDSINLANQQNKISQEAVQTYDALNSGMSSVFGGIESAISKIPGGNAIMQLFGFDQMKEKIQKNMGGALSNVMNTFKSGGIVEGMKSLPGAAMQFGKALLVGPQAAIFAIAAAVGMLIGLFFDLDGAVSETQKELGGTKKEAMAAHEAAHEMAHEMNLVGVNAKEVVKGMSTVSEILGGIDVKNMMQAPGMKEMVKDATLLSEKFGLSKEEIENVHSLSIISGKSMGALAGEAIQVAGGVMKTKDAVKLLGGISKDVAISFKGGTKELIAAAAKAKLLGTDLKKVKDIGMGMLDIESSLEKEMEARVLTGKNLNLDAARQYALQGDVASLQEELLKQAGSLEEFSSMGPIQQKAMADAMGMTVEEMTTMLTKAEEMNKLGLDKQLQEDLANATAEERAAIYKKQAEGLQGEARELALRKAAEEESASTAEKFGDIMAKVKETAMKLVTPILDMVHGLMDGVTQGGGLMDAFDGIISVLKPIMDILFGLGKIIFQTLIFPFKLVFSIISPIIDAVKEVFSVFSSGEESAGGLSDIFDGISSAMSMIHDVVAGIVKVFIGGLVEPGKIFWKGIITPLWDTFKGIYDTLSKAFEPLFAASDAGEETVGVMDTVKKVISSLSPILEVIGGLIAGVIMKPFQMIASLISIIIKLFTGDMTGAVDELGEFLFNRFLGIPEMVITAVTKIIDNIFGTNLTESITSFFGFIKDGFKLLAGFIEPIFNFIKKIAGLLFDYVLAPFKLIGGVIEGIGKMFTGDLVGGLEIIGRAVFDFFMTPVNYVMGLFDAFVDLFKGIGNKIKSAVKDLLPGWALDILGLGDEEPEAATSATKASGADVDKTNVVAIPAAAEGGMISSGGLTLVGENGPEIVTLPQGASVASTSATEQIGSVLGSMGTENMSSGGGGTSMAKVEQKLDTLIGLFSQVATQPTVIKFGDKTVEEIKNQLNFKKSYNVGVDNTYGRTI